MERVSTVVQVAVDGPAGPAADAGTAADSGTTADAGAGAAAAGAGAGAVPAGGREPALAVAEGPGEADGRRPGRPCVTELRLSAFKSHRAAVFPLGPVTVFAGPAGSGKSSALEALLLLSRLSTGEPLASAVARTVRGGAAACAPAGSGPDGEGRRGFRLGCTVDGPAGPVRLDLAVQTEPELRVVGERLAGGGVTLLETALRDPGRRTVQAAWHTAGHVPVTRAPLSDDRLATSVLPLRVAGTTEGQRQVLAAAEQVLIALRAVFPVEPVPSRMRRPALVDDGMLRPDCGNLSAVLHRTAGECRIRHRVLVEAVRSACGEPLEGVVATQCEAEAPPPEEPWDAVWSGDGALRHSDAAPGRRTPGAPGVAGDGAGAAAGRGGGRGRAGRGAKEAAVPREAVLAALDRGAAGLTPVDRLGDSELRFLGLALVLLTGPGVLAMDQGEEVPAALRAMTVVADGLDAGLDPAQTAALLTVARRAAAHGHVRVLATAHDPAAMAGEGVTVVPLDRR